MRRILQPSMIDIQINGKQLYGLLDTGASEFFMTSGLAKILWLSINKIWKDQYHWLTKVKNQMWRIIWSKSSNWKRKSYVEECKINLVNYLVCKTIEFWPIFSVIQKVFYTTIWPRNFLENFHFQCTFINNFGFGILRKFS